jgi:hypothetical protein
MPIRPRTPQAQKTLKEAPTASDFLARALQALNPKQDIQFFQGPPRALPQPFREFIEGPDILGYYIHPRPYPPFIYVNPKTDPLETFAHELLHALTAQQPKTRRPTPEFEEGFAELGPLLHKGIQFDPNFPEGVTPSVTTNDLLGYIDQLLRGGWKP